MSRWKISPPQGYPLSMNFVKKMQESVNAIGSQTYIEVEINDSQILEFVSKYLNEPTIIIKIIEKNIVLPAPKPVTTSPQPGTSCPSCGGFVQINR